MLARRPKIKIIITINININKKRYLLDPENNLFIFLFFLIVFNISYLEFHWCFVMIRLCYGLVGFDGVSLVRFLVGKYYYDHTQIK
jgi:hypothetical protein